MAGFISDEEMAALEANQKPGFISDEEMAKLESDVSRETPSQPSEPSLGQRIKGQWENIGEAAASDVKTPTQVEKFASVAGRTAAFPIGTAMEVGREAKKILPKPPEFLLGPARTLPGIGPAVRMSYPTESDKRILGKAGEVAGKFSEKHPRVATLAETGMNLLGAVPVGAVSKGAITSFGKGFKTAVKPDLNKIIETGISKGIKPTVVGKKTLPRYEKFYENANDAVKTIAENKNDIKIVDDAGEVVDHPKTAGQFAQAIDQTKKKIYKQYHEMALQAGDEGAAFKTTPIIQKLEKVASEPDEILASTDPRLSFPSEIRQYANSLKKEILELEGAPPEIIEKRIEHYNKSLKGFYDGRVTREKAEIDASVANALRQELDDEIINSVGEGYQGLKNKYGSLKAIENEVNHRAIVNARKADKGLLDFTDIFSGGDLALGIVSMNPAWIAKAAAQKGIAQLWKHFNNPDHKIDQMFRAAYKEKVPVKYLRNRSGAIGSTDEFAGLQSKVEGLTPALRDASGKIFSDPLGHKAILNRIVSKEAPQSEKFLWGELFKDNTGKYSNSVGFIDKQGRFIPRKEAEAAASSPKDMFQQFHEGSGAVPMLGVTAGMSGAALGGGLAVEKFLNRKKRKE